MSTPISNNMIIQFNNHPADHPESIILLTSDAQGKAKAAHPTGLQHIIMAETNYEDIQGIPWW